MTKLTSLTRLTNFNQAHESGLFLRPRFVITKLT